MNEFEFAYRRCTFNVCANAISHLMGRMTTGGGFFPLRQKVLCRVCREEKDRWTVSTLPCFYKLFDRLHHNHSIQIKSTNLIRFVWMRRTTLYWIHLCIADLNVSVYVCVNCLSDTHRSLSRSMKYIYKEIDVSMSQFITFTEITTRRQGSAETHYIQTHKCFKNIHLYTWSVLYYNRDLQIDWPVLMLSIFTRHVLSNFSNYRNKYKYSIEQKFCKHFNNTRKAILSEYV